MPVHETKRWQGASICGAQCVRIGPQRMTEQEISQLALKIANDTRTWVAVVGVISTIVGAVIVLLGNLLLEWFKNRLQRSVDMQRRRLLMRMLEHEKHSWRELTTLARVIGCTEEQTKNHLIAINARGNENNKEVWGLLSRNPFSKD